MFEATGISRRQFLSVDLRGRGAHCFLRGRGTSARTIAQLLAATPN